MKHKAVYLLFWKFILRLMVRQISVMKHNYGSMLYDGI